MEHNSNTYRLTEQAEVDAATLALASFEVASTPHISDQDKLHAQQLRAQLPERAPTPELSLEDITFLAGASKYLLGTAHHVAERYRNTAPPVILEAAQAIADINKPLSSK